MFLRKIIFQGDVEGSGYMMEVITCLCSVLVKNLLHGMWETNGTFRKVLKVSVSSHRRQETRTEQRQSSLYLFLMDCYKGILETQNDLGWQGPLRPLRDPLRIVQFQPLAMGKDTFRTFFLLNYELHLSARSSGCINQEN